MKKTVLLLALWCTALTVWAQKKLIDNNTWKTWERLGGYGISNDGKYVFYEISKGYLVDNALMLCTSDGSYQHEFQRIEPADTKFSDDNRKLILKLKGDSLIIFDLAKKTQDIIPGAGAFKLIGSGSDQSIAYDNKGYMVIKKLATGKERKTKDVLFWLSAFDLRGHTVAVAKKGNLTLLDLNTGIETRFFEGDYSNVVFSPSGNGLAFASSDSISTKILYYDKGSKVLKALADGQVQGLQSNCHVADGNLTFGTDNQLFFKSMLKAPPQKKDADVISDKLDVWHYKDESIQYTQLEELQTKLSRRFTAMVNVDQPGKAVQFEDEHTELITAANGNPYMVLRTITNYYDAYYRKELATRYFIVTTASGERKEIQLPYGYPQLSPNNLFYGYMNERGEYFTYELATGITRNMSEHIDAPADIISPAHGDKNELMHIHSVLGWSGEDKELFLFDKYDIWKVDVFNPARSVCVTNGYGRKNQIMFRLAGGFGEEQIKQSTIVLRALNEKNMQNGFAYLHLGQNNKLELGAMDDCLYSWFLFEGPPEIKKAKLSDTYLVGRHTASEAPNLYVTKDLKKFNKLSNIHPEKNYNWMTSELVNYPMEGGETGRGILYKPQNFDPNKKYPILFHYYQQRSEELHVFREVRPDVGTVNIPRYVSNGYLVFIPDILNIEPGKIAKRATNAVVSAVNYLKQYPWVNTAKMGLQGHSFGGYETNLIIANSSLFAAAQASAGPSNAITGYGEIDFGRSGSVMYETGQPNLRGTPYSNLDVFVENSPVLKAKKITTPLLLQHSKRDDVVPFHHALEMYTALRRLQKPVWLLQYDDSQHHLDSYESQLDFHIRQQQFFDHYLKDAPAPKWMTDGIPAKDKGIKSGLQLLK